MEDYKQVNILEINSEGGLAYCNLPNEVSRLRNGRMSMYPFHSSPYDFDSNVKFLGLVVDNDGCGFANVWSIGKGLFFAATVPRTFPSGDFGGRLQENHMYT